MCFGCNNLPAPAARRIWDVAFTLTPPLSTPPAAPDRGGAPGASPLSAGGGARDNPGGAPPARSSSVPDHGNRGDNADKYGGFDVVMFGFALSFLEAAEPVLMQAQDQWEAEGVLYQQVRAHARCRVEVHTVPRGAARWGRHSRH